MAGRGKVRLKAGDIWDVPDDKFRYEVEVLWPSTEARDRGVKLRRYAAAGVPHYWLLDLRARALEAYTLGESGYEPAGVYGPGAIFRPALFPGREIAIDSLWAG